MNDSLQSDTIQFEPTSRLSIGSNDTVVNETHELSTSSQDLLNQITICTNQTFLKNILIL